MQVHIPMGVVLNVIVITAIYIDAYIRHSALVG